MLFHRRYFVRPRATSTKAFSAGETCNRLGQYTDPQWPHRPVSLGIGKSGQLFVSSDASGVIIAVGHQPI